MTADSKALSDTFLDSLNPSQKEAVQHTEGPLLILAGAGTGKTRVLTHRIARLLEMGLANPHEILSVTFTNKAAQEMKGRVASLLNHSVDGLWIGTFHSLSLKILRRYADFVGLENNFTILDTDDQLRLVKQLIKAKGVDDKKNSPRMVLYLINRWKDKALSADKVKQLEPGLMADLYALYQERLKILNAVDFGDIILHCLTLFQTHPEILKTYQNLFRYILVDEYQDTNVAQYLWLRLLSQGYQNICCVGDEDQSIYGWRGAEIANILRFEEDFPGAKIVRLEQNYRSTTSILGAASGLISHNSERLGKNLWTDENNKGEPVLIRGTWDHQDEARFVTQHIESLNRQGHDLKDMAILVRAGFQTREFEERFLKIGLPYKVVGGARFYERLEIRDAIAYLRLLVQPADGLAFERIVNMPKRGIGSATIQKLHDTSRESGISLPEAALRFAYENGGRVNKAKTSLRLFFNNYERWRGLLNTEPHTEIVKLVLEESGYIDHWRQDKAIEAAGRLENLKEFVKAFEEFDSIPGFLEHISLVMDNDQKVNDDVVTLMTLHGAKGLEFDTVFLCGWEEGLFPHQKSLDEKGSKGLEEERRLGYVGISRAKKRCLITYAQQRKTFQGGWQPTVQSRFIGEIPKEFCTHILPNGSKEGSKQSYAMGQNASGFGNKSFNSPTRKEVYEPRHNGLFGDYGNDYAEKSYKSPYPVTRSNFSRGSIIDHDVGVIEIETPTYPQQRAVGARPYGSSYALGSSKPRYQKADKIVEEESSRFKVGQKVSHKIFGEGSIQKSESGKVIVDFGEKGLKTIHPNFLS